jgi:hypothetical protein
MWSYWVMYTFRNGKVVRSERFADRAEAQDVRAYRIKPGERVRGLASMLGRFGNPQNLAWPHSSERVHALSVRVRRGKPRWPGANGARWRGLRDRACVFA